MTRGGREGREREPNQRLHGRQKHFMMPRPTRATNFRVDLKNRRERPSLGTSWTSMFRWFGLIGGWFEHWWTHVWSWTGCQYVQLSLQSERSKPLDIFSSRSLSSISSQRKSRLSSTESDSNNSLMEIKISSSISDRAGSSSSSKKRQVGTGTGRESIQTPDDSSSTAASSS